MRIFVWREGLKGLCNDNLSYPYWLWCPYHFSNTIHSRLPWKILSILSYFTPNLDHQYIIFYSEWFVFSLSYLWASISCQIWFTNPWVWSVTSWILAFVQFILNHVISPCISYILYHLLPPISNLGDICIILLVISS